MREVTQTVKVYKFSELDDKAKDRVRDWLYSDGYPWAREALESLGKLAEAFGCEMTNYSVDWLNSSYSSATFDMPYDMPKREISQRLGALGSYDPKTFKGHGDCKLTGYCHDESALDGFRQKFKAGCKDLNELMQAAFRTWHAACVADFEDMHSDEQMEEMCVANEYEFTESGKPFCG